MRGLHVQCPVGPDIVMAIFVLRQLTVMLSDIERDILDFIKLLPVSPIAPLDATVHLRVPRGIKEQLDLRSPASLFELVHKLRAAIDRLVHYSVILELNIKSYRMSAAKMKIAEAVL
jgi:hypothetical protein